MLKLTPYMTLIVIGVCAVAPVASEQIGSRQMPYTQIRDMPLDQVLRTLANSAAVSLSMPPELACEMSEVMVGQLSTGGGPVDQCFEHVLRSRGFEAVLRDGHYVVRSRPDVQRIKISWRLVSLPTTDLDGILSAIHGNPPPLMPGGVSVTKAPLWQSITDIVAAGLGKVIYERTELFTTADSVSPPVIQQPRGGAVHVVGPLATADTRLLQANAIIAPEPLNALGHLPLQISVCAVHTVNARPNGDPARVLITLPYMSISSGDELLMRGAQRLIAPSSEGPGREAALLVRVTWTR